MMMEKPQRGQEMLYLKLPRFGVVARLDEDRGFGFISAGGREDVFFHFRGYPGRLPSGQKLPPVGTPVLFITGSDPRRPHEPKKGTVLWAPVEIAASSLGNAPTDQASLDALRRRRLGELPRESLCGTFETSWYAKQWGEDTPAPTDLEDEVLGQVICERLAEMSPVDLEAHQVSSRLAKSHYQFAACLSPGSPACSFARLLEVFEPTQLAVLGAPDASWIQRGRLSPDAHFRLLEWHLLSRTLLEPRGNWESFFPGTEASEVELATRFLGYDIPRDAFIDAWLDRIVGHGLLSESQAEAWVERYPDLAFSLFHRLPAASQASLLSGWRNDPAGLGRRLQQEPTRARTLLAAAVLAFDLETDGERIWEIGCARNAQASLLHDERSATDLDVAMADLGERVHAAPLVVGHNVLAWDWPIVARHIALASVPVIWDTLLIGYLLEPQAASHALGGRHHADQDALDALQLFKRQLECLPADVARSVLLGEFTDSAQLLDAVIEALPGIAVAREFPDFMTVEGASQAKLVVVPESRLRNVDWVPGVSVVSAGPSEGLAAEWREVDVALLTRSLPADIEADPATRVLVSVAQRTAVQGIALRRNMIPVWLLERNARLRSAVDMACVVPKSPPGWRIASLPASVEWWVSREPSSCVVTGLSDDVLVLDRRQVAQSDIVQTLGQLPAAPFMRFGEAGSASRWLLVDRAAHVLDYRGGLAAFTTLPVSEAAIVRAEGAPVPSYRPRFARRRHHVLHPRAEDQGSYWAEVLRTFKEVATVGAGTVPILLIVSTQSRALRDLLATGLAEIGLGEVKPEHRSQREHLLRARNSSFALVDVLDQWPVWQSLAQSAGVVLQPVVEALPIEEWHACEETRTAAQTGGNSGHEAKNADGATVISGAALLESVPALVRARLHGWMADVGLSASQPPMILIDPRLGDMSKGLSNLVDSFQLVEAPFTADHAQRLDFVLSPFKLVREEAPSGLEAMERFLVANWQPRSGTDGNRVTGFKPSQKIAMEAICERSANVLISLPTGEGKSVLFQVPALCRGLRNRRLTLVLSPLKALMRDQVERLREQGFSESVDYLSGDRPPGEIAEVIQGVLDHRIVLLYVAPERTRSGVFLDVLHKRMLADKGLEHVVVDEAHCVNQWGYEFRPDYFHALNLLLRMCSAMDVSEPTPFLLLSATITASDRARLQAVMAGYSGGAGSPLPLLAKPDAFSNPLRTHIAVEPRRVRGMLNDRRNFDKALAERLPHIEEAVSAARRNRSSTGQRSAVIVFVSSRYHAEVVAQRLARTTSGQVDYYHAGLDAGSREEIYTRFLDGDLDVLVATKAFGMGMDIPDIHWVVHLASPGYLEDYLQEVGRIGRGERERKNAQLEMLSATLLFSDQDFESIRGLRARGALSLPIIRDLYGKVCEHAYQVDGQQLAIVPAEGYGTPQNPMGQSPAARRAAATRVRMGLYWLERAKRVHLCGSVPDLIEVIAYPSSLERISKEDGLAAEVAGLILQAGSAHTSLSDAFSGVGSTFGDSPGPGRFIYGMIDGLGRLFSGLSDTVGLLFDGSAKAPGRSLPSPRPAYKAPSADATATIVVLNLSQIKLRSSALKSMGDVLAVLGDLEKRGAVSLNREIDVVPRKLASEPSTKISELFQYVDGGVAELIRRLAKKGRVEFNPFEMVEDVEGPRVGDDKRRMYERSFINGFRSLARASGIKLRQLVQPDDKVIWEAVLPRTLWSKADSKRQRFLQGAKSLFAAVGNQRSIAMSKLIDQLRAGSRDGRFRESDLNKVTGLLSAMSLVSISPELVPLSHVVAVSDADGRLEDQVDIWDELRQVNELAEARNLAMEVFANVNTDAHPVFIEGYFDTADGPAVRQFLDTQLGEIVGEDAEGPSTLLLEMQEKLRATKAVEFFERFKRSEEPAQWEVAKAPFDQHIMVNAGPGAGKTFVLVGRIAHLIREQNIDPSQIIVLAFNRAVVFEIRRRIRDLFKSLGYAAYAGRLRVSTFHSLAMRSMAREGIEITRDSVQTLLSDFATRLSADPSFAQRVAGGARCVLVDEFQDVTDDVYRVIKHLHSGSGSRAGVMVIGDDDQDILRWQRKIDGSAHQFSEKYFDHFARDFGGDGFLEFLLGVNFRSGESIVERSQSMISGFFERTSRSRRLKTTRLRSRMGAAEGSCQDIEWRGRTWGEAVEDTAALLKDVVGREGESTVVLCRSNAEVAEAHRLLSHTLPNLTVQGASNLRVAELRHVALWLDHLREAAAKSDAALSDDLRREVFSRMAQAGAVLEFSKPATSGVVLDHLWELCCRERSFPHLSSLIQFVEELRTDELTRLTGMVDDASTAVVSTLHKVKGLEFDNVVILPSAIQFGGGARDRLGPDLKGDAAEEARLLYVGMTRAKKNLTYYRGDRERSWGTREPVPYEGLRTDGRVLVGSMEDVSLGWAMQHNAFNPNPDACQGYIETEVAVGDPIVLGGRGGGAFKSFMHQSAAGQWVQVGFLAKQHVAGGANAALKVSAVVRFRPDQADGTLAACVRERGWGYAVLISGRLR
ncbi:TPA: UvrD-helicase domain-containing protein [Stenotrophomonas maltophilia]|nr:UvrD-helicase domain-containing protein [Stenotrophomonas maltophilia]HDX0808021.1 UvrD-helicase domain-containing protein [Stenotrophomonas maltophilia]HDX0818645.1 UvrD-helicase domain-containing protein [Stenotrophomonas maltophilia]HDX0832340.1 UvrD-helicase domain-containing protein [Stenotrophomonas maltophilia]HDX0855983.1 UvrD-helicase domain-containing protein [Stenotrophomonas maltophilia]